MSFAPSQQNEAARTGRQVAYGVVRKDTREWFGGFAGNEVRWVGESDAKQLTKAEATAQAALLCCFENNVQRKPAVLS